MSVSAAVAGALLLSGCSDALRLHTYDNPYENPQIFMEGIYAADKEIDPPSAAYPIRAVILPHHLTATRSMAAGVRMLQNQSFKHILLLSPDHFDQCPTPLCTVNSLQETQFGKVYSDRQTVRTLSESQLTTIAPEIFKKEHGVHAVLPYIAHYFPDTPVTAVVLSQKNWKSYSGALLENIKSVLKNDTILMVSSDFSHYLSLTKSNEADERTAETLFSKNLEGVAQLKNPDQTDCAQCLWVLGSIAAERGFYNPSTVAHTNSAILLNNKSVQETTSHFAMVWYQNAALTGDDLAVAGDVTMTRTKRTPKMKPPMQTFWSGSGLRVVNLEGPLLETCPPDRTMFNFCNQLNLWKGMLDYATHWGIMNNHTLDQYVAGLAETRRLIPANGEVLIDDHMVDAGPYRFIGLTGLMNPVLDKPLLDIPYQYRQVIAELKNRNPDTMTIVFIHEGIEYRALTSEAENEHLRSFIDAGADVVIAAHTHVVSDMEIYKGKPIFRGVGNFIFDQYDHISTTTGKAVRLRKGEGGIEFESLIERI